MPAARQDVVFVLFLQSAGDARHEAGGYYSPTAARPESAASSSPPTSGSIFHLDFFLILIHICQVVKLIFVAMKI